MKYNLTNIQEEFLIDRTNKWRLKIFEQIELARTGKKIKKTYFFVGFGDISDWIRYCNLILAKDYKGAFNIQNDLDTSSRETIPNAIYFLVEKAMGY